MMTGNTLNAKTNPQAEFALVRPPNTKLEPASANWYSLVTKVATASITDLPIVVRKTTNPIRNCNNNPRETNLTLI